MPPDRIYHCWLSTFDYSQQIFCLFPALKLFYYAELEKDNKVSYKDTFDWHAEKNLLTFEFLSCFDKLCGFQPYFNSP